MEETPYEKLQKQEKEIARINRETMEIERKKNREIPDKLERLLAQKEDNKNSNRSTWYGNVIIGIVVTVIGSLIVWGIVTLFGS